MFDVKMKMVNLTWESYYMPRVNVTEGRNVEYQCGTNKIRKIIRILLNER